MSVRHSLLRRLLPAVAGVLGAGALVVASARAKEHVPVPLAPDAPLAKNVQVATFALGWFWGPDAQFGSLPGVLRTRVGYAGGVKDKPTYRDLGDHTEALQIEFDPRVISYEKILELFWREHDPWQRAWSTQYKSVLWTHGDEQARQAEASVAKLAARRDGVRPRTEVKAAGTFWLAEAYHQKYALRSRGALMVKVFGLDASDETIRNSTLAARLNGWLSGYGTPEEIQAELARLEVPEATQKVILEALGDRVRLACE